MPRQTDSQKIGSLGHSLVETQIKASELWIARNLTEDFGIDIELEFAPNNDEVKGRFIKAQIKSHKTVKYANEFLSEPFSKGFLRYVYECRVPIILIIAETSSEKTWYVWLQKWLIDSGNVSNLYDETTTKTLSVNIAIKDDFKQALKSDLTSIASWENKTQLYIAVKDLANLSLTMYDEKLSEILFDYLGELKATNPDDPDYIELILNRVIELGMGIWATPEGNKVSRMLFKFLKENGEKINSNHISKLIIRGESCSRTGINALGLLYDNYPQHTASLKLKERFKKFSDPRVFYYCSIREKYLGTKSPHWLEKDLEFGNFKADFSEINTSIFDKWANRGDSVILDYVYYHNDSNEDLIHYF